ncbi:hypothetical protein AUJ65_01035 [Candidatus Micrarchaeota archaeon CG1_02_51_15]|nr:MAG: hypothetical protein AUJ65_01035 [Candidatus Micrarchaeota archaeon CG1_02_51_15]
MDCQGCGAAWLALDLAPEPPLAAYLFNYLSGRSREKTGEALTVRIVRDSKGGYHAIASFRNQQKDVTRLFPRLRA